MSNVFGKIKGLMPATRRSVTNIDGKLNEITDTLGKLTKRLEQLDKKLNEVAELEKKQVKNTDYSVTVLRDNVKTIREEVHNSCENVKRVREEVHNSFDVVKNVREEVHDNNTRMKSFKEQMGQVQEQMSMVKNQVGFESKGVFDYQRKERIIVSLTTYPKRIATTTKALERIFAQSLKPDKIVLWLSEDNFPEKEQELPLVLLAMKQRGLEIKWCQGDIRSYKKLVPALKEYPNDIIITLDDDLFYDLELIEKLYNSYQKYPKAISAMRTHKIQLNEQGEIDVYANWVKDCSEYIAEPRKDLFATTGAGTLFPPAIFSEEVLDEKIFMELAPTADDMWVKTMALKFQVPIVLVQENRPLRYIDGTQEETLWGTNITQNDIQFQNLLSKYDITVNDIL